MPTRSVYFTIDMGMPVSAVVFVDGIKTCCNSDRRETVGILCGQQEQTHLVPLTKCRSIRLIKSHVECTEYCILKQYKLTHRNLSGYN